MSHRNSGACQLCQDIMDRYPGLNHQLRSWFEGLQAVHPEAHVSCAGRGKSEQEYLYSKRKTRARYGESAHNFNAGIDLFVNQRGLYLYDETWFKTVLAPEIHPWLNWYGAPGSSFMELPHVEIRNWRELRDEGKLSLVEPINVSLG